MTESSDSGAWHRNYFNYFTEIEEQFQRARGTGLFLLSPLDWALIEAWKNSGIPLEAVLRGIDASFEKWRARKNKSQLVNSLTYCAQAVMQEAEAMANNLPGQSAKGTDAPPFPIESIRAHLANALAALEGRQEFDSVATALSSVILHLDEHYASLEELDQRLTAMEDKLAAIVRAQLSDEKLFAMRRELEMQLKPYRGKMTADQLARLEKSFLDRKIYSDFGIPRLSLFFIA